MIMVITCVKFQRNAMNNPILILGKNGQVGRNLTRLLGDNALAVDMEDVDFNKAGIATQIDSFLGDRDVAAVINAAAYTAVDMAEGEGKENAYRINVQAVDELAAWCKKRRVPLVHYSTDYVYDGSGDTPRKEDDGTGPLSVYGQSKLEGEQAIIGYDSKYLIFRTSWIYDAEGKNFFLTMLRLMKERTALTIVDDQVGAPTYALHLARATIDALSRAMGMDVFPSGVYHLCNRGETSWCGFANAIFMLARQAESREYENVPDGDKSEIICQQIKPIPTAAYPMPARRPLNSRLDMTKVAETFGITMPIWEDGLQECFETWYGSKGLQVSRVETSSA
jgi:dTDP-4-dehydrorhamnose reductase